MARELGKVGEEEFTLWVVLEGVGQLSQLVTVGQVEGVPSLFFCEVPKVGCKLGSEFFYIGLREVCFEVFEEV